MRFGLFTFGGGWSIIAQMRQNYVERDGSMTDQELMDLTSVAKSLPGTMIANVAMLYGCRVAGLPGGVVAALSMSFPPMAVLVCISFFYNAFRTNYWVAAAMEGMQAAVVPIIVSAAVGMIRGSFKVPPCVVVTAVSFALYVLLDVSAVVLVLLGLISGLLMGELYERREGHDRGAA